MGTFRIKRKFKSKYTKRTIDDDLIVKPKVAKSKRYVKEFEPTKGEKLIAEFLTSKNIKFIREKVFRDLINPHTKQQLRFDFYLPTMKVCIEFDGAQHTQVVARFNMSQIDLYNLKVRDEMKNEYCRDKKFKMIRIPYKLINSIDTVLTTELGL